MELVQLTLAVTIQAGEQLGLLLQLQQNKVQIPNCSIENVHKNPKDPDKNPGVKPWD